jgi:predicted transport protein
MSDIKLFRINGNSVSEIKGASVALEKSLQTLIEHHLEDFLGVRFLSSEHSTGPKHSGRIDTLGIDENGCPVIIEYKRAVNENVINQGLFYLDWLMDHKADFKLLVIDKLGKVVAETIAWDVPRLLCIAGDFTRYDEHAVQQMGRNIELIRYRHYGDLLLFELVNAATRQAVVASVEQDGHKRRDKSVTKQLEQADQEINDRFEAIKAYMLALGDDVQMNTLKFYVAFKRIKNFACVQVHTKAIQVYLRLDLQDHEIVEGFTRDVSDTGHHGTGNTEVTIRSDEDMKVAEPLFARAYEMG